jgi:hypothetical protein
MTWQIILKELSCPMATKDLKLNTKNRNAAIKDEDIKYGPLNIDEPADYWEKVAEHWDTSVKAAKKSKCSNCIAFDISPRMKDCMPIEDVKGGLGYCWMHDFKCHEDRTCYTWAKGGPITKDEKSKKNQMKRDEEGETVTWQDILKIDIDEAKKLGEKYAPEDMKEGKKNNPKYLEVKELLNKVPKDIDISYVKGLIKDYEDGGGFSMPGPAGMENSNLAMADNILRTILREMKR